MSFGSLRTLFMSVAVLGALVAGCDGGGDGTGGTGGAGGTGGDGTGGTTTGGSGGTGGGTGGTGGATGGTGGGMAVVLDTPEKINAYLEAKTLTMTGDQIPSHPNGFDENTNFGSATQCYSKVAISIMAGTWNVTSDLGTLNDAPNQGDVGTCDHATVANTVMFSSTAVAVENVTESCFDITVTYNGFSQEGRGAFSTDASAIDLELYFGGQAAGHRCADGAVGDMTVKLNGADFTGNAVQSYSIAE